MHGRERIVVLSLAILLVLMLIVGAFVVGRSGQGTATATLTSAAGYPALGVAVLVGTVGVPVPLALMVCTAGALARAGHANLAVLLVTCVGAAVAGDGLGYAAGCLGARRFRLPAWPARLQAPIGLVVFVTRGLSVAGPLATVFAGARRYPWPAFLCVDLAGELLWYGVVSAVGYLLGASGERGWLLALCAGLS